MKKIMRTILKQHFGYESFRPLQEEIISAVLARRDALVIMPTGGGKSLCFQLPALMLDGITLVISPLIALMKDQVDALQANGIKAAFLNSTLSTDERARVEQAAKNGELKILYLAPERLALMEARGFLQSLPVSLIAIDEAHCISEWGHDFRPDYRNLKLLKADFPDAPTIALTATATKRVRDDIIKQLHIEQADFFESSFNRPNLNYIVKSKDRSFDQLVSILRGREQQAVIIYCFSRNDTETLASNLSKNGFQALPYHAGLAKNVRTETQEKFIRDEIQIIVATIAFGMGIDKPDVRLVVHMDLPKSIEGYYQETGRAGRDGLPSDCVFFYSYADRRKQDFFINQIEDEQERLNALRKLKAVIDYGETSACRRKYLLEYFGEVYPNQPCEACDFCMEDKVSELTDATEITYKILSAVLKTGERFGVAHVCDVLRGSKKQRIIDLGHDRLSVHGIEREKSLSVIREIMRQLLKAGYLEKQQGEYPTLRVSFKGKTCLSNRAQVLLPKIEAIDVVRQVERKGDLEYNQKLFDALRAVRKTVANQQDVPAFVIFGDRSLQEMAFYLPKTEEDFSKIFGVGRQKLEQYAEIFIKTIQDFCVEHKLSSPDVSVGLKLATKRATRTAGMTYQATKELLLKKLSVEEIARLRGLNEQTVVQHIEKLAGLDSDLDIAYLMPTKEDLEKIKQAFEQAGTSFLSPVRELLHDRYSYEELRLARLFI